VPPIHPWAKKRRISISELVKEPFILREEGSGTRTHIEKCFQKNGLTLNDMHISLSLSGLESIKTAVESGIGVSIMSRWAVLKELKYKTLKYVTLKEEKMERKFSLIQQKNAVKSHAVEEFLAYLYAYDYSKLIQSVT
ncbi:MAG: LysR substrate-binding domain-containing protein, partial [Thermodesulfovibrionales bacterium]|nr:LysR substrate-binding domain-containing protein [Thermodesulfovibrionales bacterium]